MFPECFCVYPECYRVGELQSRVDQRQKLVIQATFQADDVIDDSLFYLNEPITEQMGSDILSCVFVF